MRQLQLLRRFGRLALMSAVLCLPVPAAADIAEVELIRHVRIGALADRSKAQTLAAWQPTVDYLQQHIPSHQFEVVALDFPELEAAVANSKLDFVITNPSHYVLLEKQYGVTRIALMVRAHGGDPLKQFGGVIVTRADRDDIEELKDLAGKHIAAVNLQSLGGYQMPMLELLDQGIRPEQLKISMTGMPHDLAIRAMLDKKADAAFVRSGLLESMAQEGRLNLQQIKIINPLQHAGFPLLHSTRLLPEWPLAVTPRVKGPLADKVLMALLSMPRNSEITRAGSYYGWAIPGDYQPVHEVLQKLRLPPYDKTPPFSLADVMSRYRYLIAVVAVLLVILLVLFARAMRLNRSLASQSALLNEEMSARINAQEAMAAKSHILGMLTRGDSLAMILQHMAFLAEAHHPGMRCSILLVDEQGKLRHAAAPSLPETYTGRIDGLAVGPEAGSCGAAAFSGEPVIAADIATHPSWAALRDLAAGHQLASCWSIPVLGTQKQPLATLSLFFHEKREPTREEMELLGGLAQLASLAIEQYRNREMIDLQSSVFDNSLEGIVVTDAGNRILRINQAFTRITGYEAEEVLGKTPNLLNSGLQDQKFYREMWRSITKRGSWRGEVWNRRKSGEFYAEILNISTLRNERGEITHHIGIFSDITDIKESQKQLETLANYDPLTGLPNRSLMLDRLRQGLARSRREKKLLAVCFIDLDGFKPINDTYGHATGDKLLVEVGKRLNEALRGEDTASRIGGDEFVLLITSLQSMLELEHAITRVLQMVSAPYLVEGRELRITASIGITVHPQDSGDQDALLRHADLAMYQAKQSGKNRFHLFDTTLDQQLHQQHQQLERLRQALANHEFVLYYQPKVNMRSGVVVGMEALIRWNHPERGMVPPLEFLPLAENSDLSIDIGNWVIEEALRQIQAWMDAGLQLVVSVNVCGRQLQNPAFIDLLDAALARHPSVPSSLLELEILETSAIEITQCAHTVIEACKRLGVSFSLDDFGTGYSSLSYLKQLAAKTLKIDQTFVRDMLDDPEDFAIVEGIVSLAKIFEREVIAEGVESIEHGVLLMRIGCDLAQGYGVSRPMPSAQVPAWVEDYEHHPRWKECAESRWDRADLPLLMAKYDHSRWVHEIAAAIHEDRDPKLSRREIRDHHRCRFGQWQQSHGRMHYGHLSGFDHLDELHADMHALGKQMLELRQQGDLEQARSMIPQLEDFGRQISDKLDALHDDVSLQQ